MASRAQMRDPEGQLCMETPTAQETLHLSILIVDDEPEDLELMRFHLQSMEDAVAHIEAFHDTQDALEALGRRDFDAVVLDYQLGTTTGLEFFRAIRAAGCQAPTVLLTDHGSEALAVDCLHAGMADYIPKSAVNPRSLRRAISNAVEKACLRRDLAREQTRLKQVIVDLRCRNEEIQSFYHTLSHELKTPLTAAREFISILLDGIEGAVPPGQLECLERVLACCEQMKRLLDDILDSTRLETGKLCIEPRMASLVAVADQAVAYCAPAAEAAGVLLGLAVEPGIGQAWFDPERILQVLTNLIGNAIKFSPRGQPVTLRIGTSGCGQDAVCLAVEDRGRGIAADQLPRVFERLYQADRSDTTIHGGLGIGLYLCRELVRQHGQEIEVQSTLNSGSTFTFRLARRPGETDSLDRSEAR